MSEERQAEHQFFSRELSYSWTRPKPPTLPVKLAVLGVVAAVAGAIFYFTRSTERATLWVLNPGPDIVHLEIQGAGHDIDAGKLVDVRIELEPDFELGAFKGEHLDAIKVDLKDDHEVVCLVDLGGDAAYAVVDISSYFDESGTLNPSILYVSPPKKVHHLPYSPFKLIRPGLPIPEKGSWALQAFQKEGKVEMYKVFRLAPKRLENKGELLALLKTAIRAKQEIEYENLQGIVETSTQATR